MTGPGKLCYICTRTILIDIITATLLAFLFTQTNSYRWSDLLFQVAISSYQIIQELYVCGSHKRHQSSTVDVWLHDHWCFLCVVLVCYKALWLLWFIIALLSHSSRHWTYHPPLSTLSQPPTIIFATCDTSKVYWENGWLFYWQLISWCIFCESFRWLASSAEELWWM